MRRIGKSCLVGIRSPIRSFMEAFEAEFELQKARIIPGSRAVFSAMWANADDWARASLTRRQPPLSSGKKLALR